MDKDKGHTSTFLFSNKSDSRVRFGLEQGNAVYSKSSNPTQDIFQRRIARLYNTHGVFSCDTHRVISSLLTALAGCNEKIAVSSSLIPPLYFAIKKAAKGIGINIAEFATEQELEKLTQDGIKAVFVSSASYTAQMPLKACSTFCRKNHIPLIVDNTIATGYSFMPFMHGASIVLEMSELLSSGSTEHSYTTVIDRGGFHWMYNNSYSRLYPFSNSKYPMALYVKTSCKKYNAKLYSQLQADYYMLLEGLRTLEDRLNAADNNCRMLMSVMTNYCTEIYSTDYERFAMFFSAEIHSKYVNALKQRLGNITVASIPRLFQLYSCTAVFFDDSTIYVKCGTEPFDHIKPLFTVNID